MKEGQFGRMTKYRLMSLRRFYSGLFQTSLRRILFN
jgi:hypothetical protein